MSVNPSICSSVSFSSDQVSRHQSIEYSIVYYIYHCYLFVILLLLSIIFKYLDFVVVQLIISFTVFLFNWLLAVRNRMKMKIPGVST